MENKMSNTKIKNNQPVINNGGTVVNGGNVSDGPINNPVTVSDISTQGDYGSKVKVRVPTDLEFTDTPGVIKSKDSGTFSYNPEVGSNYIIRGAGDNASKINDSNTTVLNVGGVAQKTVHKLESTRKIGSYATAAYDVMATPSSGIAPNRTKGVGAGDLSNYVSTVSNAPAKDVAASSSRLVPGTLTYHIGVPVNDVYAAKNVFETDPNSPKVYTFLLSTLSGNIMTTLNKNPLRMI
jgi:hypothetical protein